MRRYRGPADDTACLATTRSEERSVGRWNVPCKSRPSSSIDGGLRDMSSLDDAAHVVQLALTPIFLLNGVAALLNVFARRLGRVADRVNRLKHDPAEAGRELASLRLRSRVLDFAVFAGASSGALTCCAALTIFLGTLGNADDGQLLFGLFGGALVCLVIAVAAFSVETVLSGRSVREQATDETADQTARVGAGHFDQ